MRRLLAVAGATALLVPAGAGAASIGPSTPPSVVNRETVQAELSPDGSLDVARLFSQLTVVGNGRVTLSDPTSVQGLRNLDGFASPTVRDGSAQYTIDVQGTAHRRTVSDFTKKLPVTVRADYLLDGRSIKAKDIVGKSGQLEVRYTIVNVSGSPTDISWKDGKGVTQHKSIDLVTPYVGQLTTTLPSTFTAINAPRADAAADGHGGALLAWTMVLFSPIGETTQTFGYTAHVVDGVLPAAKVQIVPVPPSKKPELAFGQNGFKEGATQASDLTAGAGLIDSNLLKLQGGAGELLAGLTKLSAGAAQLSGGLSGQIAPGAKKLADGATAANKGSTQLRDGLGQLSTGANTLGAGVGTAKQGSTALAAGNGTAADGAAALATGIDQILAGVQALPTSIQSKAGYLQLQGALTKVKAGIGTTTDVTPTTVLGGLNLLRYGLRSPLGVSGCNQTAAPGTPTACGAADGVQLVQTQLATAAATGGKLAQLLGAAQAGYASALCPAVPSGVIVPVAGVLPPSTPGLPLTCVYLSNLAYGLGLPAGVDPNNALGGVKAQTALAAATLAQVFQGIDAGILPGIAKLKLALSNPACDLANPEATTNPCGIAQVQTLVGLGIGTLVSQISTQLSGFLSDASTGASKLADGTSLLATGSAQLDSGLSQLAAGADKVSAGARSAATGAGALTNGLGQLDNGASALSRGIGTAASGAAQLASGLDLAKGGDTKVVAGAKQLRAEGTQKLIAAGNDTASVNAERYATLLALGDKAKDGALPYGAPAGATGSAAYDLTLAAATSATRDNALRGVLTLGLLSLALAVSWALRRRWDR